jgi:hypothetical protein
MSVSATTQGKLIAKQQQHIKEILKILKVPMCTLSLSTMVTRVGLINDLITHEWVGTVL